MPRLYATFSCVNVCNKWWNRATRFWRSNNRTYTHDVGSHYKLEGADFVWRAAVMHNSWMWFDGGWIWVRFNVSETHYRSYHGWIFTGQMTQPAVSKHWRKIPPGQLYAVWQDKHTKHKHNHKRIKAQWNGSSETKTNPEKCKKCSPKCAYDCAQLQYIIQHRTVLIISPLTSNHHSSDAVCQRRTCALKAGHTEILWPLR